jgi:hypothetical protein
MHEALEIQDPGRLEAPFPEVARDAILPIPHLCTRFLEQSVEEPEIAEVPTCTGETASARKQSDDLLRCGGRLGIDARPPALPSVLHERKPAFRDLAVGPELHDIGADREEQMDVVLHHRKRNDIDRHPLREELEAFYDPRAASWVVEEKLTTNAARDAVIDTGASGVDDVTSAASHRVNLRARRHRLEIAAVCLGRFPAREDTAAVHCRQTGLRKGVQQVPDRVVAVLANVPVLVGR